MDNCDNYSKEFEQKSHYNSCLKNNTNEIRYVDLCSGIGGFRVAIDEYNKTNKKYEFKCVLSADIKQDAIDTYNINFNEKNKKLDINNLKIEDIPKFNLLCSGFPCQPFSTAGNKKGFSDNRGGIIFKIIDLCKYHKPSVVILENVYNLISLDKGECLEKIKLMFEDLGYNFYFKKLNSSMFNCAQSRERVYIICLLNNEISFDKLDYSSKGSKVKDIIDYSDTKSDIDKLFCKKLIKLHNKSSIYGCKIGDKRGGNKNIHSWDIGYNGIINEEESKLMEKIMTERRKKHWADKKCIKWMDGMPLTYDEISTFYKNNKLSDMLSNLVEKKYLKMEKCKDLINGKRVYKEDSEEGYNICKGKLSFPISKILDPDEISPTLTATDSNKLVVIIEDKYIRKLNINELKRLCGFPETFIIPNHVDVYDLFGNMATPPVILNLLKLIYD